MTAQIEKNIGAVTDVQEKKEETVSISGKNIVCSVSDVNFINNTENAALDTYIRKLIGCGVLENNLVLEKGEKVYLVDLLDYVMKLNGTDYANFAIPSSAQSFRDLSKESPYARLVYHAYALGYIDDDNGNINAFREVSGKDLSAILSKTIGDDKVKLMSLANLETKILSKPEVIMIISKVLEGMKVTSQ